MMLFYHYFSVLLILFGAPSNLLFQSEKDCDLQGDWTEVSYLITPEGKVHSLSTLSPNTTSDSLQLFTTWVHSVYFSGQGNIGIESGASLQISKKKIRYKGQCLGRYTLSNNCLLISLPEVEIDHNPEHFAQCKVVHRFENVLVLQQGNVLTCYLKRDSKNPYFVGE
jgi:hypothetical protein